MHDKHRNMIAFEIQFHLEYAYMVADLWQYHSTIHLNHKQKAAGSIYSWVLTSNCSAIIQYEELKIQGIL